MEIHYAENGLQMGYLPRSLESLVDTYLLNAWLQIEFLDSVGITNPYTDIKEVKDHTKRLQSYFLRKDDQMKED